MNEISGRTTFRDFKRLNQDERDYFVFSQLEKLNALDGLDARFAGKWVEVAIRTGIYIVFTGIIGSILWVLGVRHWPSS